MSSENPKPEPEKTLYEKMVHHPISPCTGNEVMAAYQAMPARSVREKIENAVDGVLDGVVAPAKLVALPFAVTTDLITGIFGGFRNGMDQSFTNRLMQSRKQDRAWQRMCADRKSMLDQKTATEKNSK